MKSLKSKLLNEGFYQNAGGLVRPTTKDELMKEIRERLRKHQTNLNDIDTSRITDMSNLFVDIKLRQNIDISQWDVSNVKDMHNMFYGYKNFNCDLSKWDVSNVENMNCMFFNCQKFNSDLSKWDVSNVKTMMEMFCGCTNFNCDLSKWDVKKVKNMYYMFDDLNMKEKPSWYKG